jgi:hypothetical protein
MMKTWDRVERTLVGVPGLAALAFALWQVLSHYFFPQQSISYAEEVIVYLAISAIMVVSSQLVRTDSHVWPDLCEQPYRAAARFRHDGQHRADRTEPVLRGSRQRQHGGRGELRLRHGQERVGVRREGIANSDQSRTGTAKGRVRVTF